MADETKTTERKRRRISPEDKVRILQEILLKGKKVSEAAEENDVHPTQTT
jgi:transposase-like protein